MRLLVVFNTFCKEVFTVTHHSKAKAIELAKRSHDCVSVIIAISQELWKSVMRVFWRRHGDSDNTRSQSATRSRKPQQLSFVIHNENKRLPIHAFKCSLRVCDAGEWCFVSGHAENISHSTVVSQNGKTTKVARLKCHRSVFVINDGKPGFLVLSEAFVECIDEEPMTFMRLHKCEKRDIRVINDMEGLAFRLYARRLPFCDFAQAHACFKVINTF
jgi:hypothetical protein